MCSSDLPLYMITSAPAPQQRPVRSPPPTLLPLSQLSFNTPDRLLPHFFCSLASHASVSRALQQRHLLFLKSVAERLEAGQLLGGGDGGPGEALQPQDLLLWDCRPRQIGGALYYRLHSAVFPGRVLAAKVRSHGKEKQEEKERDSLKEREGLRDIFQSAYLLPYMASRASNHSQ